MLKMRNISKDNYLFKVNNKGTSTTLKLITLVLCCCLGTGNRPVEQRRLIDLLNCDCQLKGVREHRCVGFITNFEQF